MKQYDNPMLGPLAHGILVVALASERVASGSAVTTELLKCGCPHEDCDRMVCSTCGSSECKRPGYCIGRCAECGAQCASYLAECPARTLVFFNSYCSQTCSDISWKRADDAGLVIKVGDLTPERLNEMLNNSGLQLAGIGPMEPS